MPPRPKTIKDIAAASGFSVASVSQALRGVGRVSPASVQLIRQTADKMGYRPNLFASGLRSASRRAAGAQMSLGVLRWQGEYPIEEFMLELRAHCKQIGAYLREADEPEIARAAPLLRKWRNAGVQALIIAGHGRLVQAPPELFSHFAVVAVGRVQQSPYVTVSSEVFSSINALAQVARQRGYRRIGWALCRHPNPLLDDQEREGAWHHLTNSLPASEIIPPYLGEHADYGAFTTWAQRHRPDMVVGFHEGHYYTLKEGLGWDLPRTCGVCILHKSNIPSQAFITGYTEAYAALARASLSLADSQIRHRVWQGGDPVQWHMIHREFIEGTTLPPR